MPTRREFVGAAAGASLALTGLGHRAVPWRRPVTGPIALWAADRAGHAVYGLDADGLVVLRVAIAAPLGVTALTGGACTVISAPNGRFDGVREVRRVGRDGSLSAPLPHTGSLRTGSLRTGPLLAGPLSWERIVGSHAAPIVAATQPSAERGATSVWILRNAGRTGCRLERWICAWGRRWSRAFLFRFPWGARALAGTRSGVWLVGERVPEVRFVTATGRVAISRHLDDLDGSDATVAAGRQSGGGVWIAACGALARLDRSGARLPGQGGFAHLVALSSAG